ncbi:MAG: ABC transporter permease [Rhodanobacter sp.]
MSTTRPRWPATLAARLGLLVATLAAESMLLFGALQLMPGDAASTVLGTNATPASMAAFRRRLGLDHNLAVRYGEWIGHALTGNLGTSTQSGQSVTSVIAQPLLDTLILAGIAGALIVVCSLAIGIVAGVRPGSRTDTGLSTGTLLVVSVPAFVFASVLAIVFAGVLHLLPAASLLPFGGTPLTQPDILVLPALSLVIFGTAWASRLVRAAVADATVLPHVEAARLAGLPLSRVLVRHLLPETVGPCAQAFAWLTTLLVGGTVVVEQIYSYPGLGQVLVTAVRDHDTPVVEAVGLLIVAVVTVAFVLADAVTVLTNPKLREER